MMMLVNLLEVDPMVGKGVCDDNLFVFSANGLFLRKRLELLLDMGEVSYF